VRLLAAALLLALTASASASAAPVQLKKVGQFKEPVYVTAPRGDSRLFVVERAGVVRIVSHGRKLRRPFLDIRDRVLITSKNETQDQRGLFSIAFAPGGVVYAAYVARDDTLQVDSFRFSGNRADPASRMPVFNAGHAGPQHHGGQLQIGPDGLLYVSTGIGDHAARAQDPADPHGKIFRIRAGHPEVYATGLRNPWRFSFDRRTGAMAIGDVGESYAEEVDYLPPGTAAGVNFGFDVFEGTHRLSDAAAPADYVAPAIVHTHRSGWCALTGGYVIRDRALRGLYGRYVYGDLCSGRMRTAVLRQGSVHSRPLRLRVPYLDSFGEDGHGRVYVVSFFGQVWRLARAAR
jgi:glucose/arabinose dehydrogenase